MSGQKLLAKMLVTQFAHLNGPKKVETSTN